MRKCTYPVSFGVRSMLLILVVGCSMPLILVVGCSMPLILVVGCSMPPNVLGIEHTRTETGSVHFNFSPRNF